LLDRFSQKIESQQFGISFPENRYFESRRSAMSFPVEKPGEAGFLTV
jgi:K+-transporting ATPase c subunit